MIETKNNDVKVIRVFARKVENDKNSFMTYNLVNNKKQITNVKLTQECLSLSSITAKHLPKENGYYLFFIDVSEKFIEENDCSPLSLSSKVKKVVNKNNEERVIKTLWVGGGIFKIERDVKYEEELKKKRDAELNSMLEDDDLSVQDLDLPY